MMVSTDYLSLEQTENTLDCVGVGATSDILTLAMGHCFVPREFLA